MNILKSLFHRPMFHEDKCGICFEEYNDIQNRCTVLACGHLFHTLCINSWQQVKSSCPLCQRHIVHFEFGKTNETVIEQIATTACGIAVLLFVYDIVRIKVDYIAGTHSRDFFTVDKEGFGIALSKAVIVVGVLYYNSYMIYSIAQNKLNEPKELDYRNNQ